MRTLRTRSAALLMALSMSSVFAATWQEGLTYTAGTQVDYQGKTYSALVTHTAYVGANWNPASTPTLWTVVASSATATPTTAPTAAPTATPVVTAAPTATPKVTVAPTAAPTTAPTAAPTATPTAAPTAAPIATPAAGSCAAPTWTAAVYSAGSIVSYNGHTWKAQWYAAASDMPKTVSNSWDSPWLDMGTCSAGGVTPAPTATPVVTATPTVKPTATPQITASPVPTATAIPTATPLATATPAVASYKPQITYVAAPAGYPSDAQMTAAETALMSQAGTDTQAIARIRSALRVLPDTEVEAVVPGRAANPSNARRVERIVSESLFNQLFPVRNIAYSYTNLLRAVAKFPAYCDDYSDGRNADKICAKLLATSFAHFTQETGASWATLTPAGAKAYPANYNPILDTMDQNTAIPTWNQALWYLREMGYNEGSAIGAYQDCFTGAGSSIFSIFYACGQNAQGKNLDYFGRGSKQLSYNFNYGPFSKSLYGDVNVLLDNPGKVADTWLNFASAVWFAVYPQSPKPPMTWVVDGTWVPNSVDIANNMQPGFGSTINIINGGIECGGGSDVQQVKNRIAAYQQFAAKLGVDITGEQLSCKDQRGFQPGSAAATKTYLDKSWGYNANNPGGVSWACQLVDYQMPFSLATPGDYKACVDYMFRGQVKKDGVVVIDNTK